MQSLINHRSGRRVLAMGGVAGLIGGAAEVAWIAIYMQLKGGAAAEVARGVSETVFPGSWSAPFAVGLGLVIHMGLALVLGGAIALLIARALPQLAGTAAGFAAVVGALVLVWAMNFLVILPLINPAFVTVVPYAASLTSKLLFGVAAALVLHRASVGARA